MKLLINQILNSELIYDNSLIMAIIAINMTVIGLTSLADKKTVIGVDYGEFLIKEYKVLGIRMYLLLFVFALVNIVSLFTIFINEPLMRLINFGALITSLVFAIYYFFGYILVDNRKVAEQVYIRELLGLYRNSNDNEHFYIDEKVGIRPGTRTKNKLSTSVIGYFSVYNSRTQHAFKEIFGPNSIIYSRKKRVVNARKRVFDTEPYNYRKSSDGSIYDISHEFFQLFRYMDHQERWILDILEIFQGNNDEKFDELRLFNFARCMAQIDTFGTSENLYKYKFIFNLRNYWYKAVGRCESNTAIIKDIEKEIIQIFIKFVSKAMKRNDNTDYKRFLNQLFYELILTEKYNGMLSKQEIVRLILIEIIKLNDENLKLTFELFINDYLDIIEEDIIELKHINNIVRKEQSNEVNKEFIKIFNN